LETKNGYTKQNKNVRELVKLVELISLLYDITIRLLESGEIFLETNEKKVSEIS